MEEQKNQEKPQEEQVKTEGATSKETSSESEKKESAEKRADAMLEANATHDHVMSLIGYIIPFLFFVPLMTETKDKEFVRFHANQQLVLLIAIIIVNILGEMPIIGWLVIAPIGMIFVLIWVILGVINVANKEMKKLPIIGGIRLLK